MKTVNFTEMKSGTKDEYLLLDKYEQSYIDGTADRILNFMKGLTSTLEGYKITRLEHSLQTATRAFNDKADEEMVVAALLHDIGHLLYEDKDPIHKGIDGYHENLGADYLSSYFKSNVLVAFFLLLQYILLDPSP